MKYVFAMKGLICCTLITGMFFMTLSNASARMPAMCFPASVAELIAPYMTPTTLVVASSDFSHYLSNAEARAIDDRSIRSGLREAISTISGEKRTLSRDRAAANIKNLTIFPESYTL
jgi:predicted class III extradiol MEMO1 family dioxygenase